MTTCCDMDGTTYSHCAVCHRTFLGVGVFDAHQDVDYSRRPAVTCHDPATLGMTQNDAGVWGTPEGHASRAVAAARFADSRRRQRAQSAEQDPALVSARTS